MQIREEYYCTACDWLGYTILLFVTQLAETYILYVFRAVIEGRLVLPSFFNRVGSQLFCPEMP